MRKFNRLRTIKADSGFTLIELLIFIMIFAIIAMIAVSAMSRFQDKAKAAKAAKEGTGAPIDDVTSSSAVSGGFPLMEVLCTLGLLACVVVCVVFAVRARTADGSTGAHRGEQVEADKAETEDAANTN